MENRYWILHGKRLYRTKGFINFLEKDFSSDEFSIYFFFYFSNLILTSISSWSNEDRKRDVKMKFTFSQ